MQLFRYRADRIPVLLITALFLLDVAVFAWVDHPLALFAWTLAGILPKGYVCAWNHHHQHLPTFKVPLLNRALELIYGLHTGLTAHAWTLHHTLGHHPHYLDQTADESRWQDASGRRMHELRYTVEVSLTAYPRAWIVSRRYRHLRPVFVGMGLATLALLAAALAWRPLPTLFVFVLPMLVSLFVTSWATYTHHAGRPTDDHMTASTNIVHRGYNLMTGNLGYHTAHHYKGGVHWSLLPQLHAQLAHVIPADAYMMPGFPFTLGQKITQRLRSWRDRVATEDYGNDEASAPAAE
jgi:fatty acid desaturase